MNDKMRSIIYDTNMALNDIIFERKMFKKDQREFIKISLVQGDLDIIRKILEMNEQAFNNHENIVVSYKNENGRFDTKVVKADFLSYNEDYRKQADLLNRMVITCEEIIQYMNEPLENETDEIMSSLYSSLGIDEPEKKNETNEEVETLTVDDEPESEAELERIMREIHEKANTPNVDETEVERLMQEVHEKVDSSDSKMAAENLINNLSEKGIVLKKKAALEPKINKIAQRNALRLKDNLESISNYYNKFESKNGFSSLDDFDESLSYVQTDLENVITYLNGKALEYEKLYSEKKPIVIPNYGEIRVFTSDDLRYETAYNYITTEIKLAIAKGEVLLFKYFQKKEADKSDINYAMEMMFNEVKDTLSEIENSIGKDSFNVSMQFLWIDSSIKILNDLKSKLETDYKNGNPIRMTSLKANGIYEVMTVENSKENYEKQYDFLNKVISDCENMRQKLNAINESKSKKVSEKSISEDIDKKYVVAEKDGKIVIIGRDITKDDIKNMKSPILKEAKNNKMRVTLSRCNEVGLYNVNGILVEIDNDGNILIGGEVQKIEFHNQNEMYRTKKTSKKQDISSIVDEILACGKNSNISQIMKLFKSNNPSLIWKEIDKRIDNGELSKEEFFDLKKYLEDNYDNAQLKADKVFLNGEYLKLEEKLKNDVVDLSVGDSSLSSNDAAGILPVGARRVKERREKKSLIKRFKELKTWKKVAIVAGLSIAGIAIIGTGVYHLVPGVKPMIDGFIQNLNPNHVNEIANQAVDTVKQATDVVSQTGSSSVSVDFSSLGQGHTIFNDAFSAVSGQNPHIASSWFSNNPLDVFNTSTNQFMHLTSEQLHDAEFLKTLAEDPNNAILFGKDMVNPDGFVSLADIASEIIKGGKVL